ncbi:MAG TPA: hypothetical protein VMS99_00395 [Acidimicrobiia bacterium]|nr:hypothetical protein [Acidimicrobiia bacterium]
MVEPPRNVDSGDTDREPTAGMSRWVKVIGIILIVLVLLVVVMLVVVGAGGHQIPQHAPSPGAIWVDPALARILR